MNMTIKVTCCISFLKKFINKNRGIVRVISTNPEKQGESVSWKKPVGVLNTDSKQFPQSKKRFNKKKKLSQTDLGGFRVVAYSTAEGYDLEKLKKGLLQFTAFTPTTFSSEYGNLTDFVHAVNSSQTESESRDLFFFREGSVVMWNISDSESRKILELLKDYEDSGFIENIVQSESEIMSYNYSFDISKTKIIKDQVIFSSNGDIKLEKYTISDAMGLSVLLGTYEASLEQYIETMEPVTEDLKAGVEIKMSREEVLRKMGQLFALRHNITLSSNLLDLPDFYWDREELEILYKLISNYYCINKRTRVMNERINHCIELVQLLSSHLSDKHHVRLEWMIIILIMVEVGFEILHFVDRLLEKNETESTLIPTSNLH